MELQQTVQKVKKGKQQMKEIDIAEQAFKNGIAFAKNDTILSIQATVDVGCTIPSRAHPNDAGMDLYATKDGWILPKWRKAFGTGLHIAIPAGYVGLLLSKSGLSMEGIQSSIGVIDAGYTGEVKAVLYNHGWLPKRIRKGQKITQMVIMPIITPYVDVVKSLEKTDRGDNGFGSSGRF
jgi:dUTP pyrophosphatase